MRKHLDLSEAQKSIISHDRGHLRIVACPGSGKTEIVSRRVAHLIKNGAEPSKIVAFTFTEKAADALKFRIRRALEEECPEKSDFGDMYVGTIDAFCLYMLKKIRPEYKPFEILDGSRRAAFVNRWYYIMGMKDLAKHRSLGMWKTIDMFCNSVDRAVTEKVDISCVSDCNFVSCYVKYKKKLHEEKFFDFVSIIETLLGILEEDQETLAEMGKNVKHVVFDEYQDVNKLQENLLELLSVRADSVCVVGDDDQNIFQWRGSDISHILEFPKKYSKYGTRTEKLNVNYRATPELISVASRLVGNNSKRVPKDMRASENRRDNFEEGDIVHRHFDTDTDEFRFIHGAIGDLLHAAFAYESKGVRQLSYRDMAVIVRTNEDAARVTEFLSGRGVPCVADSGTSVFKRPVVELALDCIFHVFKCRGYVTDGIPDRQTLVDRYSESMADGDVLAFASGLGEVRRRADAIVSRGNKDWLPGLGLQEFYHRILSAMGAERGAFSETDMYSLAVLSKAIADYEYVYRSLRASQVEGLGWFIRMSAESSYADPAYADPGSVDAVRILTIWKAKGLEFPVVFVPSFERRRKPSPIQMFIDEHLYDKGRYDGGEEDDRRAYYTAITRSQKHLFVTGASHHEIAVTGAPPKRPRQPHPFLAEMHGDEFSEAGSIQRPKMRSRDGDQYDRPMPSSFSELSIYDRCPHDYLLRHVMGFDAGVPPAFNYGANIHNILNRIHSDYIRSGRVPAKDDIVRIFDDMFYLRFAPGRQSENMKRAGIRVVGNYVDLHCSDFGRILETEKRFEFVMGGALITGSIDLLKSMDENGAVSRIEVIDFKTDKANSTYRLDHKEQVRLYAHAIRKSLGHMPERATIHYLDTQESEQVDIGGIELRKTEASIGRRVRMIMSRRFEPTPEDSKCRGCDFKMICEHKGFEAGPDSGSMPRGSGAVGQVAVGRTSKPLRSSKVSPSMRKKALALAAGGVVRNPDGTYRVRSTSSPDTSYTISDMICTCRGFSEYPRHHPGTTPTCSHVEAVRIFLERPSGE